MKNIDVKIQYGINAMVVICFVRVFFVYEKLFLLCFFRLCTSRDIFPLSMLEHFTHALHGPSLLHVRDYLTVQIAFTSFMQGY